MAQRPSLRSAPDSKDAPHTRQKTTGAAARLRRPAVASPAGRTRTVELRQEPARDAAAGRPASAPRRTTATATPAPGSPRRRAADAPPLAARRSSRTRWAACPRPARQGRPRPTPVPSPRAARPASPLRPSAHAAGRTPLQLVAEVSQRHRPLETAPSPSGAPEVWRRTPRRAAPARRSPPTARGPPAPRRLIRRPVDGGSASTTAGPAASPRRGAHRGAQRDHRLPHLGALEEPLRALHHVGHLGLGERLLVGLGLRVRPEQDREFARWDAGGDELPAPGGDRGRLGRLVREDPQVGLGAGRALPDQLQPEFASTPAPAGSPRWPTPRFAAWNGSRGRVGSPSRPARTERSR